MSRVEARPLIFDIIDPKNWRVETAATANSLTASFTLTFTLACEIRALGLPSTRNFFLRVSYESLVFPAS